MFKKAIKEIKDRLLLGRGDEAGSPLLRQRQLNPSSCIRPDFVLTACARASLLQSKGWDYRGYLRLTVITRCGQK